MNPFDNLRPMPPSPCGCAPRPWPRPVVPVPVTPQMQPHWAEELKRILDGKQDAISDLDDIREGAQAGATAYQKPEDGVPKTDLVADVQASLDNADTAVQPDDILSGGKIKSDLLPSYVDDVIEVANYAALPATGESGKIYVTLDTNKTYRWGGSEYVEISNPDLTNYIQKKSGATAGNLARFKSDGDIEDSGKKPADFAEKTYVDNKSYIKSPDGDTVVSADNDGTAKIAHTTHALGNAKVTFPDGFSIDYYGTTYTAPSGGETIEFFGPIRGSGYYYYWVPEAYKDATNFDPSEQYVWCLYGTTDTPFAMMYQTGPSFNIINWNSPSPMLDLTNGEVTGGSPDGLIRESSSTTTTKTAATTDQIPVIDTTLTQSDKAADAKATGDVLALKANDDAVVKLTGNQTIAGSKTFTGGVTVNNAGGISTVDPSIGAMVQFKQSGVEVYPAGGSSYVLQYPVVAGVLALLQNIAPTWVDSEGIVYQTDSLWAYNGVLYRCKLGYTYDYQAVPPSDTTHWETATVEKMLSILRDKFGNYLPLSGGTVTGDLKVVYSNNGFTVEDSSGNSLSIKHETVAGNFWYINYSITGVGSGSLRLPFDDIIPADVSSIADYFDSTRTYEWNSLCVKGDNGLLYRCINPNGHTGEWVAANWALATVEDVLAALRTGKQDALTSQQLANIAAVPNKANASDLRYAISESIPLTVTGGAAATTLEDRMHNVRTVAAPGSGNTTTITATLPPIVQGKSRDMFLNLTVGTQASDAGDISLSIVEPSGATVQIDIGSVEDIGIGKNEILISENALPTTSGNATTTHWLVTVRHEDFAS